MNEKKLMDVMLSLNEEQQEALYNLITMLKDTKKGEYRPTQRKNPYEHSEIMRLIGKQSIAKYSDNQEIGKNIQCITKARGYDLNNIFDVACDLFLYGCITGKREERAKKKATAKPSTVKQ